VRAKAGFDSQTESVKSNQMFFGLEIDSNSSLEKYIHKSLIMIKANVPSTRSVIHTSITVIKKKTRY